MLNSRHRVPPEGALVIPDLIETYVRSLPRGKVPDPDKLVISCKNAAVRSVFALVNNNRKKECILDSGCQVVTISRAVSHELGISYDPTFCISMQSANGELDMSLGLARNVPFKIGPVTFYMQAHVIDSSAYDVLLGRPFDVLTESVIQNFTNEDQTITIHDPNTGQHVTVPTLAQGTHKADQDVEKDF
jgi:Aspartyl protease